MSSAHLPLKYGDFECRVYQSPLDGLEQVALISHQKSTGAPLLRLHSECLTGDIFGSLRCDCGEQLASALTQIAEEGGILIYLRQEGRGIGLASKIQAYTLQDQGMDTVEANLHLGFEADQRCYITATDILKDLGITSVRLMTNNPKKIKALEDVGIDVETRVALQGPVSQHNKRYLLTKRDKLGHLLMIAEDEKNEDHSC